MLEIKSSELNSTKPALGSSEPKGGLNLNSSPFSSVIESVIGLKSR